MSLYTEYLGFGTSIINYGRQAMHNSQSPLCHYSPVGHIIHSQRFRSNSVRLCMHIALSESHLEVVTTFYVSEPISFQPNYSERHAHVVLEHKTYAVTMSNMPHN